MAMLEQRPPIIAEEQIAKLIGISRFEEIRPQIEQFKIEVIEQNKQIAKAIVEGFHVHLVFRGNNVEGACNCPESDGFDFCPHCAALCLHLNRNAQQISTLSKGPDKSRVLAYLLSQDKQTLAKDFLALINEDAELFDRYLLRASLNQGALDYSSLKTQITELTRKPERLFSQRQVKHFFAKIERFIDELNGLEDYPDPDKMLKLMEHMYLRLNRLLDEIDDNSCQRKECVTTFRRLFSTLLQALNGKAETKAKRFLKLWINNKYSIFPTNLETFLEDEVAEKFSELLDKICIQKDKKYQTHDYSFAQQEKMLRFLFDNYTRLNKTDQASKAKSCLDKLQA